MPEEVEGKIKEELNVAIKGNDEIARSTLRMLLAVMINKEKEKNYKEDRSLTEEERIDIIFSEAKKRREAIIEYEKGNRQDLADKEKAELEVLQKYLPEQLSEEEVKDLVIQAVKETGAETMQDIGKVMGSLMPKVKGKADGSLVSKIVKELLNKND
ncbi:GatB/YqeY domain-containing protein [Patescibacteria group bacterium]|nr:GatB/YqeY domain-containing protein [Patescibacteria group bacterium]